MNSIVMKVVVAFGVAWASPAFAARFNDTGMTQCRGHGRVWSTDCATSGQDAQFGRDVAFPNPEDGRAGFSFVKVCHSGQLAGEGTCPTDPPLGSAPDQWGCTLDAVTGQTWELKTRDGGPRDMDNTYSNLLEGQPGYGGASDAAGFVSLVNGTGLCGANDWRLPSTRELQGLLDYGAAAKGQWPTIDTEYFPNTYGYSYWTGSEATHAKQKRGWVVYFYRAYVTMTDRDRIIAAVRLVRGAGAGIAPALQRFKPSTDGLEVTDRVTGLIWRRCAEGMAWNPDTQACDGAAQLYSWLKAISHAQHYAAQTGKGWRVPNVKELSSLVDERHVYPAIDPVAFPNTPGKEDELMMQFLSGTPAISSSYSFQVDFRDGRIYDSNSHSSGKPLRLVREKP